MKIHGEGELVLITEQAHMGIIRYNSERARITRQKYTCDSTHASGISRTETAKYKSHCAQ